MSAEPRRVALLRAVNVGGRNRVPMAELRAALGDAGFDDVDTYIQSGNLTFRAELADAAAAAAIGSVIADAFSVDTPVIVRSATQVADAVRRHPWTPGEVDEKFHHVVFLAEPPPPDAVDRLADRAANEDLAVVGPDLHVRYRAGVGRSKLTIDVIDRRLATTATGRNLTTVRALAELASR